MVSCPDVQDGKHSKTLAKRIGKQGRVFEFTNLSIRGKRPVWTGNLDIRPCVLDYEARVRGIAGNFDGAKCRIDETTRQPVKSPGGSRVN